MLFYFSLSQAQWNFSPLVLLFPVFFAYVADSDLEVWTLLPQIYFVVSFPAGKEHVHSKSSLVTIQTWVNTAK